MSKIVLTTKETNADPQFLAKLRASTDSSLAELQEALRMQRPLFVGELFLNNHVVVEKRLREIAQAANQHRVTLEVYELEPSENFESCERDDCRIDVATLLNILDEATGKFA